MPEWLSDALAEDAAQPWSVLAVRLLLALGLGLVVAGVYRLTRRTPASEAANLVPTLVLLTVIITMVTLAIGNSVARAFSLVGALAIVRFRTVVEDTRDTAFVIFAVAVGLAVGAGFLSVPLAGIPVAAAAAFLFRPRTLSVTPLPRPAVLTIRVGIGHSRDTLIREAFAAHVRQATLVSTSTARQGASLDLTYHVHLSGDDAMVPLVTQLNRIEGVQDVSLRNGRDG